MEQHEPRAAWLVGDQSLPRGLWIPADLQFQLRLPGHAGLCSGSTYTSLASRGIYMSTKEENVKTNTPTTPEVEEHVTGIEVATGEQTLTENSQATSSGTQEVQLRTEQPPSVDLMEVAPTLSEGEEELLRSPLSSSSVDAAAEQLDKLKVRKPNLSTAQRRAAIIAKLEARGERWDPAKWRRNQKYKTKKKENTSGSSEGPMGEPGATKRPRGESVTPTSSQGPAKRVKSTVSIPSTSTSHTTQPAGQVKAPPKVSYRDMSATKMAVVLSNYPTSKLTTEQGEIIENAIIDELRPLEDGTIPSFAGSYMEKGALILSCRNQATCKWMETSVPKMKLFGDEANLVVGPRKDILRTTRVFFRAHPKLNIRTPDFIIDQLDQLNPTFKVKTWNILPPQKEEKGYGFVCFIDEECFRAVAASNYQANLGIWQVQIVTSAVKDHASDPSKPPPQ